MTIRPIRRLLIALLAVLALSTFSSAASAVSATVPPDQQILVMVQHPPDHYRPNGAYGGGYGDGIARSARERLARRIARAHGLTLVDAWPMPMIGLDCFVMVVPSGRSTATVVQEVSRDADVQWAQPVALYQAQGGSLPHNDPLFAT